jgi:hypothetical protein
MKSKMWLVFFFVQAVGIVALHVRSDWPLILGVVLLFPGLPMLYLIPDIHRLLLIRNIYLTIAALFINAAVWHGVKLSICKLRKHG